jgi:hypothetical protein
MCNLQGWLVDAIVDICGAETGSACGIEDVLAVLLGGSWFAEAWQLEQRRSWAFCFWEPRSERCYSQHQIWLS